MKRVSISLWGCAALCAAAVLATLLVTRVSQLRRAAAPDKLDEAVSIIRAYYVGDYDEARMRDAAVAAMVASLGDRWSVYLTAEQAAEFSRTRDNRYEGLGIVLQARAEGGVYIVSVYASSPAGAAGVLPGSRVAAVDGEDTAAADMEDVKARIHRGMDAGSVTLRLLEPAGAEREFTLVPGRVETDPVAYTRLESGEGYIRIGNFEGRCAEQAVAAVDALLAEGATGLVFDVRDNPGGQLAELLALLDYLLPEGTLFISKNVNGETKTEYSEAGCVSVPMAVLMNRNTYSAAEFFAAALDEYGWAVTIGEQTTGKGYVQVTVPMTDGSAIHISFLEYFTPRGKSLAGVGLAPAVPAALSDEGQAAFNGGYPDPARDEQLREALSALAERQAPAA